MKALALVLLIFIFSTKSISARSLGNPDLDDEWEDFKQRYDKAYELTGDEETRRSIWEDNLAFINKHNIAASNGEHSYTLGINALADWTTQEIVGFFNGYNNSHNNFLQNADIFSMVNIDDSDSPTEVNWVNKGYVTGVKDQKQCGSCWAFSTTGSLEGQHFKSTGKLVSLSEQNLVDCDHHDLGCMGGLMQHAFTYIEENKGIDTESSYPYTAKTGRKCLFKPEDVGATLKSYKTIPQGDENALKNAVATVGPISVAIDASKQTFHFYRDRKSTRLTPVTSRSRMPSSA